MKATSCIVLMSLFALSGAAQTVGGCGMTKERKEVTGYSPVGFSCFDYTYPWRTDAETRRPDAENPGVAGIGVNFLFGACGEMNGLLLNLGVLGKAGSVGSASSMSGTVRGVTVGALVNANGPTEGIMAAPVNVGFGVDGCMVGLVNSSRRLKGLQVGAVNLNEKSAFSDWVVQVGLYNRTDGAAFQVGLINKIVQTGGVSVLPIVNCAW